MKRYTRSQKRLLALAMPVALTIVAVNVSSALGASEAVKDNIVLMGLFAVLAGLGWTAWTFVRRSKD
jgi:hypothetical protein